MRGLYALALSAALLALGPAAAAPPRERIVADLSHSRVAITTDFVGSEILIYGAVKRDAPAPAEPPLSVIITVEGPPRPVTLLHKTHRFGLWVNEEGQRLPLVPSFYAVASSGFLQNDITEGVDSAFRISLRARLADAWPTPPGADDTALNALARLGQNSGAFAQSDGAVRLAEDTLFRADVALPARLIEGDYIAKIYLTRDGEVVDWMTRKITVRKTGIERAFTRLARESPLAYGLLTLALAAGAGSAASAFAAWRRG